MDPASSLSSNASVLASPGVVSYGDLSRAAPVAFNSMGQHGERLAEQRSFRSDPSNSDAVIAQLSRKVLNLEGQIAGLNARVEVLQRSAEGADILRNTAAMIRHRMGNTSENKDTESTPVEPFRGQYAGYSFRDPAPAAVELPHPSETSPGQAQGGATTPSYAPAPAWALELQATCARQHTRIRQLELELALRSRPGEQQPGLSPAQHPPHSAPTHTAQAPTSRSPHTAGKVHTPHTDRVASSAARLAAASRGMAFPGPPTAPPQAAGSPPTRAGYPSAHATRVQQGAAAAWPAHNLFASSAVTPFHDSTAPPPDSMLRFMASSRRFQLPAHNTGM